MLPHAQLVLKDECARLVRSWTGEPSSAAAEPTMPDPSFVMRPGRLGLGAKPAQLRGQAALSPADLQLQRALKKRGGGDKPDAIGAAGRAVAKPSSAAARSDEVDDEDEDEGRTSRFSRKERVHDPLCRPSRAGASAPDAGGPKSRGRGQDSAGPPVKRQRDGLERKQRRDANRRRPH